MRTGAELLTKCFGSESRNVSEFEYAGINSWPEDDSVGAWDRLHRKTLNYQLKLLEGCIDQLRIEVASKSSRPSSLGRDEQQLGTAIFLVHGQNMGVMETVARFLERLGLEVLVLQEQADKGRTVIEKFEDHASEVGFAVVLLTADDRGGPHDGSYESQKFRARQNAWLELGYFIAQLGRPRLCALHEEGVEIPSDYSGVLFKPLDRGGAWRMQLAKEIKAAGIQVDMNKAVE